MLHGSKERQILLLQHQAREYCVTIFAVCCGCKYLSNRHTLLHHSLWSAACCFSLINVNNINVNNISSVMLKRKTKGLHLAERPK